MASNFEADYRRESGIHRFTATDQTTITGISADSWAAFEEISADIAGDPSNYILTPELITSPVSFTEMRSFWPRTLQRIKKVELLSTTCPSTTVLLGTASLDDSKNFRNSLQLINNGRTLGFIDKQGHTWPQERLVFPRVMREKTPLDAGLGHAALICSDMVAAHIAARNPAPSFNRLPDETHTLMVSAAWALEVAPVDHRGRTQEVRYRSQLERAVRKLFEAYDELNDVIVIDRSLTATNLPPYNAHFQRLV